MRNKNKADLLDDFGSEKAALEDYVIPVIRNKIKNKKTGEKINDVIF